MSVLIIAEPTTSAVKSATLTTISAAAKLDGDLHVMVIGTDCAGAAEAAARIAGVSKILVADAPQYEHPLAENVAPLITGLAKGYSHVLAPATTFGKNVMPRVAALLDVAQLSEIVAVESADTFQRPIYAGNAIATMRSPDPIKVITVRGTAFEAAAAEGGSAAIEPVPAAPEAEVSRFVGEELSKSERPELVLLQSSGGDKAALSLGHPQAATSNSEFTKAAWATMSSPPIPFTCPFLIIAKAS